MVPGAVFRYAVKRPLSELVVDCMAAGVKYEPRLLVSPALIQSTQLTASAGKKAIRVGAQQKKMFVTGVMPIKTLVVLRGITECVVLWSGIAY